MSPAVRRQALFWLVFALLVGIPVGGLFLSKPLFLARAGVEADLLRRAAGLKGTPAGRAAGEVGRMAKAYLDATRHVSRAEVEVRVATAERLAFVVLLPWSEVSGKQRRLRAEALGRLAAAMLRGAGAEGVRVEVEVRRWRMDSARRSDPAAAGAAAVFVFVSGARQTAAPFFTFAAWSPFGPWTISKVTRSPSWRVLNPSPWMAEK